MLPMVGFIKLHWASASFIMSRGSRGPGVLTGRVTKRSTELGVPGQKATAAFTSLIGGSRGTRALAVRRNVRCTKSRVPALKVVSVAVRGAARRQPRSLLSSVERNRFELGGCAKLRLKLGLKLRLAVRAYTCFEPGERRAV